MTDCSRPELFNQSSVKGDVMFDDHSSNFLDFFHNSTHPINSHSTPLVGSGVKQRRRRMIYSKNLAVLTGSGNDIASGIVITVSRTTQKNAAVELIVDQSMYGHRARTRKMGLWMCGTLFFWFAIVGTF